MANPRDCYEILGIAREADAQTIRSAFRKLARAFHPDLNPSPAAETRFKEIAAAYAVLSDAVKRAQYDAGGSEDVAESGPADRFANAPVDDWFDPAALEPETQIARVCEAGGNGPPRGSDIETVLTVPLERIHSGGEEKVRYVRPGTCFLCHGSGRISERACAACGGAGRSETQEQLTVLIPIGAEEGLVLRVAAHGLPSEEPGGIPGDLCVTIRTSPDPRFERHGADLWRIEPIDLVDAVLGTRLEVPGLDGPLTIVIPPGTQAGHVQRIRGSGLATAAGGRGDLSISIQVRIPRQLSATERALYQRLRALQRESSKATAGYSAEMRSLID